MTLSQVPLEELTDFDRIGIAPENIRSGTLYVGLENVAETGNFVGVRSVSNGELASSKFAFTRKHILYGKLRPNLRKIARPDFEGVCSTDIIPILPRPSVDRDYLAHYLRLDASISFATARAVGVNLPRISPSVLGTMPIPVPTIGEQRRIAAILDQAEALRAKRRQALAKLDTLTQSLFLNMFGDAQTIRERWPTKALGDLLNFLTSGSRGWAAYYAESGSKFLRIQNVRRNRMDFSDLAYVQAPCTQEANRTRVRPDDVLLSITADLGRTAVVPQALGDAYINQHLAILRTDSVDPHFLSAFLASPAGQRQISAKNREGVKAGLNFDNVRSIWIPTPPRDQQTRFRKALESGEGVRSLSLAMCEATDGLFHSLQHQAFRGTL